MAKPPLIRDLNRHFYQDFGEWYPLKGEEYILDPIPGYVIWAIGVAEERLR